MTPKYRCQVASAAGLRTEVNRSPAASPIDVTRAAADGKRRLTSSAVAFDGVMMAAARRVALVSRTWLVSLGSAPEWISGNRNENRSWIVTTNRRG